MASTDKSFQETFQRLIERLPWRRLIITAVVLLLVAWLSFTPKGLLGKADAVGFAVCHRIDSRSFHLGERQIPFCARCTGQYLGAMISLAYLGVFKPRCNGKPPWIVIGILFTFVLVYAVDGANSYIHLIPGLSRFYLYEPSNLMRLLTGTGLGLGIGVLLYPAYNETIWKQRDPKPVIAGYRDFTLILVAAAGIVFLVLTENPLILYPLSMISAAGVLILLTLVYTMIIVMIFRFENRFEKLSQLTYFLFGGFFLGLVQIFILDILRYWVVGSWSGFHLG